MSNSSRHLIVVRKWNCAVCGGKVLLRNNEQSCSCGTCIVKPTVKELFDNFELRVLEP